MVHRQQLLEQLLHSSPVQDYHATSVSFLNKATTRDMECLAAMHSQLTLQTDERLAHRPSRRDSSV